MKQNSLFLFGLAALFCLAACANDPSIPEPTIKLTRFVFERAQNPAIPSDVEGLIDHASRTILVRLDADAVTNLTPTIQATGMGWYEPDDPQDFTDEVLYTMYSKDGYSSIGYKVIAVPEGDLYDVEFARYYLEIGYAGGESATNVMTTVQLANSWTNGCVITWTSSTNIINISGGSGTVTNRPSYAAGDLPVVLTATITKGAISVEKRFPIIILREDMDDAYRVEKDLAALTIGYTGDGDSALGVTKNVILYSVGSEFDSAITWESSVTAYINVAGVVTRPLHGVGDTPVTLTATATKGKASDKREFQVIVTQEISNLSKAQADLDALVIGYAPGDSASRITQNLTLAITGSIYDSTIAWVSSDIGHISNGGVVVRPAYGDGNKTITLTATAAKGSESTTPRTFSGLTVIRKAPESPAEKISADAENLRIGYASDDSATSVTKDLTLTTTGTNAGVTIAWTSDKPAVISVVGATGEVTRPAEGTSDETVVLTATISCGGESTTKEFPVTVKKLPSLVFANSNFEGTDALSALFNSTTGLSYSTTYSFSGAKSLYVLNSSSGNRTLFITKNNANAKGSYNNVTFWIRGTATGAGLVIRMANANAFWVLGTLTGPVTIDSGQNSYAGSLNLSNWTKITLRLQTGENPSTYPFEARGGSGGNYNFYIDDIYFE